MRSSRAIPSARPKRLAMPSRRRTVPPKWRTRPRQARQGPREAMGASPDPPTVSLQFVDRPRPALVAPRARSAVIPMAVIPIEAAGDRSVRSANERRPLDDSCCATLPIQRHPIADTESDRGPRQRERSDPASARRRVRCAGRRLQECPVGIGIDRGTPHVDGTGRGREHRARSDPFSWSAHRDGLDRDRLRPGSTAGVRDAVGTVSVRRVVRCRTAGRWIQRDGHVRGDADGAFRLLGPLFARLATRQFERDLGSLRERMEARDL